MGVKDWLTESLRIRQRGPQEVRTDTEVSEVLNSAPMKELMEFIKDLKEGAKERREVEEEYKLMVRDSLIGSAVELITEDATQEDDRRKKVFWVVEKDEGAYKGMLSELNSALEEMDVEHKVWGYVWRVLVYGGVFLKTYYSEFSQDENKKLKEKLGLFFDVVDDYSSMSELMKYGDSVGFCENKRDEEGKETGETTIYSTKDYIHILNDRGDSSRTVVLSIPDKTCPGTDKKVDEEFKIRVGTSYLETARDAYKIVDLLETIILSVRFGRSALYRLFQVEVGGASKAETAKILREFKQKLSQAIAINVKSDTFYSARKPVPYGQNIYIPVRNGKGEVKHELVGGDFDIKEIADLDYFRNKLFAALRIPKSFLGFEETMPGGIGNQSLTRIDIRYARNVRHVKAVIKDGVQKMLEFYCAVRGHEDWIGKFSVETSKIVTADELDKKDNIMSNIELAKSIQSLLGDGDIDKEKLARLLVKDVLDMDDIYNTIFVGSSKDKKDDEGSSDVSDGGGDDSGFDID